VRSNNPAYPPPDCKLAVFGLDREIEKERPPRTEKRKGETSEDREIEKERPPRTEKRKGETSEDRKLRRRRRR